MPQYIIFIIKSVFTSLLLLENVCFIVFCDKKQLLYECKQEKVQGALPDCIREKEKGNIIISVPSIKCSNRTNVLLYPNIEA